MIKAAMVTKKGLGTAGFRDEKLEVTVHQLDLGR
jgi:hypothetical protein